MPAGRLPRIRFLPGQDRRVRAGHPWAFANELNLDAEARALAPGAAVTLIASDGRPLGTATFNLRSLIAARLFSREPDVALDAGFLAGRLAAALALRGRFFGAPYYRLVHAEGDGLPGFVIDRFGDAVVVQANTAGADRLLPDLLTALAEVLAPEQVVLRNDSPVRELEGLPLEVKVAAGRIDGPVEVEEGGCRFPADLLAGQKTGWFYDLAPARGLMAGLARGGRMLDLYCHTGGFAVRAAVGGATSVLALDRSEPALALAAAAAGRNGVVGTCRFQRGDAFAELERLGAAGERFPTVIADPPSFVKSKKELKSGARGYRKLARLAAQTVAPGGFLFIASCSHHVGVELFAGEVAHGIAAAGRNGRVLVNGGAGPDHPVHPLLPESAYLKYQVLQLD